MPNHRLVCTSEEVGTAYTIATSPDNARAEIHRAIREAIDIA